MASPKFNKFSDAVDDVVRQCEAHGNPIAGIFWLYNVLMALFLDLGQTLG